MVVVVVEEPTTPRILPLPAFGPSIHAPAFILFTVEEVVPLQTVCHEPHSYVNAELFTTLSTRAHASLSPPKLTVTSGFLVVSTQISEGGSNVILPR